MKPVRVMTVDGEEITVRPLTLLERLAYYGAYAVGWVAAEVHGLLEKLHGKQAPKG
jgi:hypothetical protein